MEHLRDVRTQETRLTQAEVAALLDRWKDEKEDSVSVSDLAEALHCSKEEIETLVWKQRAQFNPTRKRERSQTATTRTLMLVVLAASPLCLLFGVMLPQYTAQSQMFSMVAALLFAAWVLYSMIYVIADAIHSRD